MFSDLFSPLVGAWLAFATACLCGGAFVGLLWGRIRNHFRHEGAKPAVSALAYLMLWLMLMFIRQFISRLILAGGDVYGSAALANNFYGNIVTVGVASAVVAVFVTLVLYYPNTRPRDPNARTRVDDA